MTRLDGLGPPPPQWALDMLVAGSSKRTRAAAPQGAVATETDEPPVRLRGEALHRWRGELVVKKADGVADRSASLVEIGRMLHRVGCTRSTILAAVMNRDAAIFEVPKFAARPDAGARYAELVDNYVFGLEKATAVVEQNIGQAVDVDPPWQPACLLTPQERALALRDTWLDRYLAYCKLRTDAPAVFHEALGAVALSAVVGRRGGLHLSKGWQYPTLWVMLIAPSTIYRKSTALDLLRDILTLVSEQLMAPNDFTPQRFVAIMAENDGQPLVFVRDEFSGFYDGLNRLEFMAGLKELMCDLYDGRAFRREKQRPRQRKGDSEPQPTTEEWKYDIKAPFLSLAVGTTLERFLDVARPGDIGSGFLPRFALIAPDGPASGAEQDIGELTAAMSDARSKLVNELLALQRANLKVRVERAAFTRFNAYMRAIEREAATAPNADLAAIVGARCGWMAFHGAVLLAAASSGLLELAHLYRAMELSERWRHATLRILDGLAPSLFERKATRLISLVRGKAEQGMSRRDAMRALRVSRKEIKDLEDTLEDRGEIRIVHSTGGPGPQRTRYFHA